MTTGKWIVGGAVLLSLAACGSQASPTVRGQQTPSPATATPVAGHSLYCQGRSELMAATTGLTGGAMTSTDAMSMLNDSASQLMNAAALDALSSTSAAKQAEAALFRKISNDVHQFVVDVFNGSDYSKDVATVNKDLSTAPSCP